ncbi:hypothetical protein M758_2G219200 [Ceratodon purpureus]|nr:hypothetical protein M758_2G219200 [Ceratodon purpureus]
MRRSQLKGPSSRSAPLTWISMVSNLQQTALASNLNGATWRRRSNYTIELQSCRPPEEIDECPGEYGRQVY